MVVTFIVVRERSSKMTMSSVVPMKGASEGWVVRRVLGLLRELGLGNSEVVFISDQGHAIMDVRGEIMRGRSVVFHPEDPPAASSQSNGLIERAIFSVEGQIRVLKDQL